MQLLDTHPWIVEGDVAGPGVTFELGAAASGDGIPRKLQQLIATQPGPLAGGGESVEQDELSATVTNATTTTTVAGVMIV
jgi:hypothetical protein